GLREAVGDMRAGLGGLYQTSRPVGLDIVGVVVSGLVRDRPGEAHRNVEGDGAGAIPGFPARDVTFRAVAGEGELTAGIAVLALEDHAANGFREVGAANAVQHNLSDGHLSLGAFRAGFVVNSLGKAIEFRLFVLRRAQVLGREAGKAGNNAAVSFPKRNGVEPQTRVLLKGEGD